MSTHALTCYLTREYDGQTVAEMGHFYRKFDGEPATHAAELKDLAGGGNASKCCGTWWRW